MVCFITGIALISSLLSNPGLASADAQTLTLQAFEQIPFIGGPILCVSLAMFAFSTIIG